MPHATKQKIETIFENLSQHTIDKLLTQHNTKFLSKNELINTSNHQKNGRADCNDFSNDRSKIKKLDYCSIPELALSSTEENYHSIYRDFWAKPNYSEEVCVRITRGNVRMNPFRVTAGSDNTPYNNYVLYCQSAPKNAFCKCGATDGTRGNNASSSKQPSKSRTRSPNKSSCRTGEKGYNALVQGMRTNGSPEPPKRKNVDPNFPSCKCAKIKPAILNRKKNASAKQPFKHCCTCIPPPCRNPNHNPDAGTCKDSKGRYSCKHSIAKDRSCQSAGATCPCDKSGGSKTREKMDKPKPKTESTNKSLIPAQNYTKPDKPVKRQNEMAQKQKRVSSDQESAPKKFMCAALAAQSEKSQSNDSGTISKYSQDSNKPMENTIPSSRSQKSVTIKEDIDSETCNSDSDVQTLDRKKITCCCTRKKLSVKSSSEKSFKSCVALPQAPPPSRILNKSCHSAKASRTSCTSCAEKQKKQAEHKCSEKRDVPSGSCKQGSCNSKASLDQEQGPSSKGKKEEANCAGAMASFILSAAGEMAKPRCNNDFFCTESIAPFKHFEEMFLKNLIDRKDSSYYSILSTTDKEREHIEHMEMKCKSLDPMNQIIYCVKAQTLKQAEKNQKNNDKGSKCNSAVQTTEKLCTPGITCGADCAVCSGIGKTGGSLHKRCKGTCSKSRRNRIECERTNRSNECPDFRLCQQNHNPTHSSHECFGNYKTKRKYNIIIPNRNIISTSIPRILVNSPHTCITIPDSPPSTELILGQCSRHDCISCASRQCSSTNSEHHTETHRPNSVLGIIERILYEFGLPVTRNDQIRESSPTCRSTHRNDSRPPHLLSLKSQENQCVQKSNVPPKRTSKHNLRDSCNLDVLNPPLSSCMSPSPPYFISCETCPYKSNKQPKLNKCGSQTTNNKGAPLKKPESSKFQRNKDCTREATCDTDSDKLSVESLVDRKSTKKQCSPQKRPKYEMEKMQQTSQCSSYLNIQMNVRRDECQLCVSKNVTGRSCDDIKEKELKSYKLCEEDQSKHSSRQFGCQKNCLAKIVTGRSCMDIQKESEESRKDGKRSKTRLKSVSSKDSNKCNQRKGSKRNENYNKSKSSAFPQKEDCNKLKTSGCSQREDCNIPRTSAGLQREDCNTPRNSAGLKREDCNTPKTSAGLQREDCNTSNTFAGLQREDCNTPKTSAGLQREDCNTPRTSTGLQRENCNTPRASSCSRKEDCKRSRMSSCLQKESSNTPRASSCPQKEDCNKSRISSCLQKDNLNKPRTYCSQKEDCNRSRSSSCPQKQGCNTPRGSGFQNDDCNRPRTPGCPQKLECNRSSNSNRSQTPDCNRSRTSVCSQKANCNRSRNASCLQTVDYKKSSCPQNQDCKRSTTSVCSQKEDCNRSRNASCLQTVGCNKLRPSAYSQNVNNNRSTCPVQKRCCSPSSVRNGSNADDKTLRCPQNCFSPLVSKRSCEDNERKPYGIPVQRKRSNELINKAQKTCSKTSLEEHGSMNTKLRNKECQTTGSKTAINRPRENVGETKTSSCKQEQTQSNKGWSKISQKKDCDSNCLSKTVAGRSCDDLFKDENNHSKVARRSDNISKAPCSTPKKQVSRKSSPCSNEENQTMLSIIYTSVTPTSSITSQVECKKKSPNTGGTNTNLKAVGSKEDMPVAESGCQTFMSYAPQRQTVSCETQYEDQSEKCGFKIRHDEWPDQIFVSFASHSQSDTSQDVWCDALAEALPNQKGCQNKKKYNDFANLIENSCAFSRRMEIDTNKLTETCPPNSVEPKKSYDRGKCAQNTYYSSSTTEFVENNAKGEERISESELISYEETCPSKPPKPPKPYKKCSCSSVSSVDSKSRFNKKNSKIKFNVPVDCESGEYSSRSKSFRNKSKKSRKGPSYEEILQRIEQIEASISTSSAPNRHASICNCQICKTLRDVNRDLRTCPFLHSVTQTSSNSSLGSLHLGGSHENCSVLGTRPLNNCNYLDGRNYSLSSSAGCSVKSSHSSLNFPEKCPTSNANYQGKVIVPTKYKNPNQSCDDNNEENPYFHVIVVCNCGTKKKLKKPPSTTCQK